MNAWHVTRQSRNTCQTRREGDNPRSGCAFRARFPFSAKLWTAAVLAALFLTFLPTAGAQSFTTVTATVHDPNSIPYSFASIVATIVPGAGGTPTLNGQPFSGSLVAQADVTGHFTMTLASNAVIQPAGSQWRFTVSIGPPGIQPPLGTGPQSFSTTISISGSSQDISATLNGFAPGLTNISGGAGSSLFTSFQMGTNPAFTGTGLYFQLTASSPLVIGPVSGSGTSGSPYVVDLSCPTCGGVSSVVNDTNVTGTIGGSTLTLGWTGTLAAGRLNSNVVQAVVNDTNITGSISAQTLTLAWSGTLAAGRLNSNVVQAVVNDTNITGSISAQTITLGWTGTLAAGRLNSNVVQAVVNDTNITGSISAQTLTFAWSGTLAGSRGGWGQALPTPTRAGDVFYYNGTSWVTLAGNNSGTNFLQENSSGVPSWAAGSSVVALSAITAATGANTISNAGNSQAWQWHYTANGTGMGFTESSASTGGTLGNQQIVGIVSLPGSTAVPLAVVNQLTGSQTLPAIYVAPVWNTTGVVDAAILVNVTNTASGTASKLIDLKIGGTSEFNVDKAGNLTALGTLTGAIPYPHTVNGTVNSGGIPCFTSATNEASSSALTQYGVIIGGGAGVCPSVVAPPTTPDGVAFLLTSTPSGGATAPTFSWPGVPMSAQTGTTYTFLATDRGSIVQANNAAAQTYTIPDAGGTNFANSYNTAVMNIGAGTVTLTRTTSSQIRCGPGSSLANTCAIGSGITGYIYEDADGANWDVVLVPNSAIGDPGSNGIVVRTALDATIARSIGATSPITVSNADGTAGNPTLACATCMTGSAPTNHGVLLGTGGQGVGVTAVGSTNAPLIGQSGADPIFSSILYLSSLTSGGVVYGSSTTQLASSALLAANQPMVGGGAGAAPATVSATFSTLTDGATITWAINNAYLANATVTLGGNRTLNITNPLNGGNYQLRIVQDATGSRTLTLGTGCTWKVINGGAGAITLSTAANAIDLLTFTYDGTNCYANLGKNYN